MHSVSNLGARKFGREDLPTIGFATRRILRGIEITSTRIRSSADWSREQLNIVAALRFQATSWMCGPGRARLQSCPSRNLRECEFLSCGAARREHYGRARLLVVLLGPRSRSVIPRNFSSEESALQLLLIENRAFLAGSRPLGTMREEALSARVNSCPSQNLRGCESWVGGAGGTLREGHDF